MKINLSPLQEFIQSYNYHTWINHPLHPKHVPNLFTTEREQKIDVHFDPLDAPKKYSFIRSEVYCRIALPISSILLIAAHTLSSLCFGIAVGVDGALSLDKKKLIAVPYILTSCAASDIALLLLGGLAIGSPTTAIRHAKKLLNQFDFDTSLRTKNPSRKDSHFYHVAPLTAAYDQKNNINAARPITYLVHCVAASCISLCIRTWAVTEGVIRLDFEFSAHHLKGLFLNPLILILKSPRGLAETLHGDNTSDIHRVRFSDFDYGYL